MLNGIVALMLAYFRLDIYKLRRLITHRALVKPPIS